MTTLNSIKSPYYSTIIEGELAEEFKNRQIKIN